MSNQSRPSTPDQSTDTPPSASRARRRLLLKGALTSGAAAALPTTWHRPVVDSVVLPAHARTSVEPLPDGTYSGSGLALNVADAIMTDKIIDRGGYESNPWIRKLMQIGIPWQLVKLLQVGAALALLWFFKASIYGWLGLGGLLIFYMWVVWHNWRVLRRKD